MLIGVIQVGLSRQKSSDIPIQVNGKKSRKRSAISMRLRVGILLDISRTARISSNATICEHISSIHAIFCFELIVVLRYYLA